MTDEKLQRANRLKEDLSLAELKLARASSGEFRIAYYHNGNLGLIEVDADTIELAQSIVVGKLEKDLKDKQKEFAAL